VPAVKTDPRPIQDKNYQNQCIKQLLQFLSKSGYEYPISPKSLARPSAKDFSNIVGFMLRKLDPSFQDGTMKFEDEVAMNFKAMGYPYPISKTALVAAGSPHTWPALLAALTWLMEHLKCMEADLKATEQTDDAETQFESMEELDRKSEKMFFQFLGGAYTAFLRGDQAMSDQLQERLVEAFDRDNGVIEREIERMSELNAAIDEKMNQLSQHSQSYVFL
jgi:kinetochore protein NDC80